MNKNLDDFCRKLLRDLDDAPYEDGLDSESIAWEFVRFFGVSARPTMEELTELLYAAGIGVVSGAFLPDGIGTSTTTRPREATTSTTSRDRAGVLTSTRCCTRPMRSSTRLSASCGSASRLSGRLAARPTGSRRRC